MGKDAVIILAAGKGTRMKSEKAKVLHVLSGRPMIYYVITEAGKVAEDIVVVIGHQGEEVRKKVEEFANVKYAIQNKQLGTGHAVKCALPMINSDVENIIILCGDVPLITEDTLKGFLSSHRKQGNDLTLMGSITENPKGYGRLILSNEKNVTAIIEESDAGLEEKKIDLINAGIYCIKNKILQDSIEKIDSDNAQGEFYLTDLVSILHQEDRKIGYELCEDFSEILGVNDIKDLNNAQSVMDGRTTN